MEVKILDKTFKPYLSDKEIESRVFEVSKKIERDYKDRNPFFIAILNGSFMFASDLVKNIRLDCEVEFMKVSSYEGTSSTGLVREMIGLSKSIEGRDVIVIEDIVDTGHTLHYIKEELEKMNPASLALTTLLYKPEAFEHSYALDYIGFEIPNKFIVGYGLDYDGYGRNLKEIYQIV